MTNHSYPIHSDEIAVSSASSGSSSASTSSTDVYPLPFSIGQKEIVLNNDERQLVSDASNNNFLTPGTNICVTESTNVDIGNHTIFNEPVTIYQYVQGRTPNGAIVDEVECNKSGRLRHQRPRQKLFSKWRYLFVPFVLIMLLALILASLFVFRENIFNRPPSFNPINPETNKFIQGHPVYSRSNWGALQEKETPPLLSPPNDLVIISHSAALSCHNFEECANQTQHIQYAFFMGGHRDIGYNFLIGGEGGIYEGRGWNYQNSLRAKSISICFIGDFNRDFLSEKAEDAARVLLKEGLKIGSLDKKYILIGENQTSAKRFYSPGWNIVKEIKNWDHYFPGTKL